MSNKRTILKYMKESVRAGVVPPIATRTESRITYYGDDSVTFSHDTVHIQSKGEQVSLQEVNRRLHGKNPPLEGGDTDNQDVSDTDS